MEAQTAKPSKGANIVQAVATSIIAPLAVVTVLGYVSSFNTTNRLVWLAEQQERRIAAIEAEAQRHDREFRDLQLVMAKQSQIIDNIYTNMLKSKVE